MNLLWCLQCISLNLHNVSRCIHTNYTLVFIHCINTVYITQHYFLMNPICCCLIPADHTEVQLTQQHNRSVNTLRCQRHRVAAGTQADCCRLCLRQLVNFWWADVFFVARPSTCETRWKGSDAARPAEAGTKGCGERQLEPTGLREDLSYRRMDVDWDQQNGICFTHPHRHYTHARSWDISIQSRAATEQLSVCLFCF